MREIDLEDTQFSDVLNRMYREFVSDTGADPTTDVMIPFTEHVRHRYGIYINIRPNMERGYGHYELTRVFVENEARYNWLILEWT
jgi:hypothetical protein